MIDSSWINIPAHTMIVCGYTLSAYGGSRGVQAWTPTFDHMIFEVGFYCDSVNHIMYGCTIVV